MRPFSSRSQIPRKYLELGHNLFLNTQPVPEHPCLWTVPPDAVLPYAVLRNALTLYIPIINTSFTLRYTLTVWSFVVSICTTCSKIKQLYVFTTIGYLPVQHYSRNKHTRTYTELTRWTFQWNHTLPSVPYEMNLSMKCGILAVWMLKSGFFGSFLLPSSTGPTEFIQSGPLITATIIQLGIITRSRK